MAGLRLRPAAVRAALASLAAALLLTACADRSEPAQQAAQERYLTRLSRVLDRPVAPAPAAALPDYPARRALTLALPARRIDWLDFLTLHRCDLGALVGFRNSPLGRLQQPSQRLGYELALLDRAEACELPAAAADGQGLAELLAEKRSARPVYYWNATFAGPEWREPLTAAGAVSAADPARRLGRFVDHWQAAEQGRFELAAFERDLGALRGLRWLPAARQRWQGQRRTLEAAADALGGAGGRLCRNGRPTVASVRAVNVLEKVYLREMQPVLARTLGRDGAVVRVLAALLRDFGEVAPPAFQAWYRQVLDPRAPSEWQRTIDASRRHSEAWQQFLGDCAIDPLEALGKH